MPNKKDEPWHQEYRTLISAIAAILAAIIGAYVAYVLTLKPDFTVMVKPIAGAVSQGATRSTSITVKGVHGYKKSVSLSASDQPADVDVEFVPPIGEGSYPTFTTNVNFKAGLEVPVDTYRIVISAVGADGKEHSVKYDLNVTKRKIVEPVQKEPIKQTKSSPNQEPGKLKVEITNPQKEASVSTSPITVNGTILGDLPEGKNMWVVINPHSCPDQWWPQVQRINPRDGRWTTQVYFDGIEDYEIAVVFVNDTDNAYYSEYIRNGQEKDYYPAIALPSSAEILDQIKVIRK